MPDLLLLEYSELQKAGPNGVFLLILGLVWWGCAAVDKGEEKMVVWHAAVEQLMGILRLFNANLKGSLGGKCVHDNHDHLSTARPRPK